MKEPLLKYENAKLKHQLIFSIPANKEVCGRECPGCYAMKFQRLYPSVLPYRERMYERSKSNSFVADVIAEVSACKKPLTAIRIHESGEFYSQEYIDKWSEIADVIPNVTFYAFTKRIKDFDFSALLSKPNFVLIDSLMYGGLNYDILANLDQSRPICPSTINDTTVCGVTCKFCMTKDAQANGIQFKKH